MEFYEAITNLNILSSYETTIDKREKYKLCINAILENHNQLESANKDNQLTLEKLMKVNENVNRKAELLDILVMNIIDKLQSGEKPNNVIEYIMSQLEMMRG